MKTLITILAASAAFFLAGCGVNTSPGHGEKIGSIVKLSKVGLLSETWEAELIPGGMSSGSGSFGTTLFHFTIESADLASKAEKAMRENKAVLVRYRQDGVWSATRSKSGGTFAEDISLAPVVEQRTSQTTL